MIKKVTTPVTEAVPPVNNKELNAAHIFKLTIRDREHFYKIVNWLNANLGKGEEYWTMEGRVLKTLKQGKPASPRVYVFKQEFDESASLYLSLL